MADIEAIVVIDSAPVDTVVLPTPATPAAVEVGLQGPPGPTGPPGEGVTGQFIDFSDTPESYEGHGGKFLRVNLDDNGVEFIPPPVGTGDVLGPISATNDHLAVFDGPTGKVIKDSGNTVESVSDGGFF